MYVCMLKNSLERKHLTLRHSARQLMQQTFCLTIEGLVSRWTVCPHCMFAPELFALARFLPGSCQFSVRQANGYNRAMKEHGPPPVSSRRELMLWLCMVRTPITRPNKHATYARLVLAKAENRCLKSAGRETQEQRTHTVPGRFKRIFSRPTDDQGLQTNRCRYFDLMSRHVGSECMSKGPEYFFVAGGDMPMVTSRKSPPSRRGLANMALQKCRMLSQKCWMGESALALIDSCVVFICFLLAIPFVGKQAQGVHSFLAA